MSQANNSKNDSVLYRLTDIDKSFPMGEVTVNALIDVSLDIYRSELIALVGPSGSGKTTILNLLGGLDVPTRGSVEIDDSDLAQMKPNGRTAFRRRRVGFVFQFYNLVPNLTASENIMTAAELSDQPMDPIDALKLVGLEDRADHFPSQLSGGEQQRIAIARAMAKSPDVLLCDEPTGALDFETGKRMLRLLVDLKREQKITIVLITHNGAIAQAADRIVRLRSGKIIEIKKNIEPMPPEDIVW